MGFVDILLLFPTAKSSLKSVSLRFHKVIAMVVNFPEN